MPLRLAIVGRPNVGKSTLFNRIAGRKLAIVHDRPGVTRDRREATARFGDVDLVLIDTAGFEDASGDTLETRMREQTDAAIAAADVCVFVIDARAGVTPMDETFAGLVRRSGRPVILVANKCESRAGDVGISEAFGLGLGEPIPMSAEHGEGVSDLYSALKSVSDELGLGAAADVDGDEVEGAADIDAAPVRLAVLGRPNAGKSTLVNALLDDDRMITGPEPGVTRDSVAARFEFDGREVRIHDTAGLRKRAKVSDSLERLTTSDTIRAAKFAEVVLLVMDADNAFEKQDLQIADLIEREGRGLIFLITKWDLVEEPQALIRHLRERADRLLPQVKGAPVLTVSGFTGRGVDKIMPAVLKLRRDWSAKVKTRDLNDWLAEAVSRHPPPAVHGRRIRPRYISQIKSRPPTFVLMCSRADQLPEAYKRYLMNGIREAFELSGTPIRLIVRAGRNPYADAARNSR